MQLLLCSMYLMLLVAIANATPPPGYVKPPNEDKDPPRYRYKYDIGNDDGKEGQGKTETRLGDLASGRYYVNGEKSSTDVKYYADEWGYHPLVKYHAANDHSSATTHFALGEHVVKSLLNGSEIGEEVKLPPLKGRQAQLNRQPLRRRRPVQLVQMYTPVSSEITGSSIGSVLSSTIEKQPIDDTSDVNSLHNYDNQRASGRTSGFHDGVAPTSSYHQNFNNYVTLPRASSESIEQSERLASNERDYPGQPNHPVSIAGTTLIPEHHAYTPTNTQPRHLSTSVSSSTNNVHSHTEQRASSHEDFNDLFSTISDDVLHVQNAGSFGRRLKPTIYSSAERAALETKMQQKFTSGTSQSVYESSTLKSIPDDEATDELTNRDASSYSSRPTSPTTPRTTSVTYSTLIPYDSEQPIVIPNPDDHDFHNSVGAEVSSNDYKNTMNDVRQRGNTVPGNYAAIFAKIYPDGERNQGIGERVNSLVAVDSELTSYESHEKNARPSGVNKNEGKAGSSDYGKRFDHQLYVTLRQSLDTGIRDLLNVPSSTSVPPSTYTSKPIIVAELSDYKPEKRTEYSTTFPCNNDESSTDVPSISSTLPSSCREYSDTLIVTPKLQTSQSHITTSSVILNPIQAGVSLVNADQTELIGTENQRGGSPAPVSENIEGDGESLAIKAFPTGHGNELGKIVTEETRSKFYEAISPAFGQSTSSTGTFDESIEITGSERDSPSDMALPTINAEDQRIEIQKSVEIYQNAPVHEIHYPLQVITQTFGIDHLHEEEVKQQRVNIVERLHHGNETDKAEKMRRTYAELQDSENVKQFHSPRQIYNEEDQISHEFKPTYTSLESIRNASLVRGSAYHGNVVRQDDELVDHSMDRNNRLSPSLSGQEDVPRIIKLIKDNIPEVEYTAAQNPRISVKVYPIETNVNRQSNEWQQGSPKEQREQAKSNIAEPIRKVQSQLQKILNESESVQRNSNDAKWTKLQQLEQRQQQQQLQVVESQEGRRTYQDQGKKQQLQQASGNSPVQKQHEHDHQPSGGYQVQESIDETNVRQSQQLQSEILPWSQSYDAPSVKNLHGNSGNVFEDISTTSQTLQQNHPGTSISERIVEKTIHVPQPYPVEVPRIIEKKVPYAVEKIVERKVPYPVEKIIEKKIPVPQPYPVHIQVPVDRVVEKQVQILQPYPVHVEKIIEKKVPYAVQRLVPQPYPVHILQPYPVEKIIEKPVHIPITVEKIVEKRVHVPQPYPVQVPIKVPYPVEVTKYVENTVQVPYGVRYGVSYQQIMKPQSSKGLYGTQSSMAVPLYGVSLVSNHNRERERPNASQDFQGYSYDKPAQPFTSGEVKAADTDQQVSHGWEQFSHGKSSSNLDNNNHLYQTFAKKSHQVYSSKLPSLTYPLRNYSGTNRRHASYRQSTGPVSEQSIAKNEYVGPIPSLKHNHQIMRTRSSTHQQQQQLPLKHSTAVTRPPPSATMPTSSRRARQQDIPSQYKTGSGTFRQSKIEYGFKPPMVPSVQYDEKTATKVEN